MKVVQVISPPPVRYGSTRQHTVSLVIAIDSLELPDSKNKEFDFEKTPYSGLSLADKKAITSQKSQKEIQDELKYWLMNDCDYDGTFQIKSFQLVTREKERKPLVYIDGTYQKTKYTTNELTSMIGGLFVHYYSAGNTNFSIQSISWLS